MNPSSARVQAGVAAGLAVVIGGAWLLLGTPVRVRWIVARGSPPALPADSDRAAGELRAMAAAARPVLSGILADESTAWIRKAWVASILLRAPFFDAAAVEAALASPHKPTARAAAFALLDGEDFLTGKGATNFDTALSRVVSSAPVPAGRPSEVAAWDPKPAIPVLVQWLADSSDPDAVFAALLLGKIPPGDLRVRDALLGAVEEVPKIFDKAAAPDMARRKILVVDAMQSLLPWAKDDPETASRVAKVVAWIEENGHAEDGWDIQRYGLRLFQVSRGRGIDPALLRTLTRSHNAVVRQTLAHTLETVSGTEASRLLEDLCADETFPVRRAAIYSLRKRKDPLLLDLLPYLVEDGAIYCRSDVLKSVGELRGVAPDLCRAQVPLLVACFEDPWPGPGVDPTSPGAIHFAADRADVVQGAALALYMITQQCPGYVLPAPPGGKPELAILDAGKRAAISATYAADPVKRKAVVDEWRNVLKVPARPETERVPFLARRLDDRDPVCSLRAARELKRITGEARGLPDALFVTTGTDPDTAARNLIREMRKKGEWAKIVEAWRSK